MLVKEKITTTMGRDLLVDDLLLYLTDHMMRCGNDTYYLNSIGYQPHFDKIGNKKNCLGYWLEESNNNGNNNLTVSWESSLPYDIVGIGKFEDIKSMRLITTDLCHFKQNPDNINEIDGMGFRHNHLYEELLVHIDSITKMILCIHHFGELIYYRENAIAMAPKG